MECYLAIVAAQIAIFSFDVLTQEDDVSVGFLYILPTIMGFFVKDAKFRLMSVGASVLLIVAGCFIPPPVRDDLIVFFGNRLLSVITVVITGGMISYRVKLEETLHEALAREKNASALQRAFVSMVSHEFRTPLTIIDGEAYRLTKIKDTIAPMDIEKRAKSIRQSVTRMVNLIEGVLYSSRAQENKIDLHIEHINIRNIILNVSREQARATATHNIDLDVGDLPTAINADSNLLTYVFDNLIGNALKYSADETTIEVRGWREGNWAVVRVRDSGIGIPADDLPKLFEPYFRASNASGFPGSGVGLYIVQTFVRLHGGRVTVDSVVGQGACFVVHLPIDGPSKVAGGGGVGVIR